MSKEEFLFNPKDFILPTASELIKKEKKEKTGALDLSDKGLMKIPKALSELRYLTSLDLSGNEISDVSPLQVLNSLTFLNLGNNKIRDFSHLENLINLNTLALNNNKIEDIGFLEKLISLKGLALDGNHIEDIRPLENLSQLTYLGISDNLIKNIYPLLNLIKKNRVFNESYIVEYARGIFSYFRIINDKIKYSSDIGIEYYKGRGIESNNTGGIKYGSIFLHNNPLTNLPLEIVQQGNAAILRYFAEKEKGAQKLMEAKLLIVGQGGAGKTSLKRKLHNVNEKMPEPEDTTRGIDVTQLDCKTNSGEDFRLNIWDFGGQNVQHYAHQFFLTGSSLYALVTNEREQNPNFQYWLNIIEMLGGKGPVLIVQNEIAGHSEPIKNAAAIRERFDNVVNPFQQVDLSKASSDGRFKNLKEAIIHHALQLPHIGKEYPTSYVRVREALELAAQEKHYITWKDYQDLCRAAQVDDSDVMQDIATTFTILGVCLHFKDDAVLRKFVFLNPKWIIDALFELLYHPLVVTQQGQFSENDLARIWSYETYADMDDKLMRIMENFELCYLIKDSRNYMVPQRLPAEQQSYGWNEPQATRVEYEYKFMPKGIITRLTCRLHEKIEGKNVWNDAVIFSQYKARAFAREVYAENKIAIEVSGDKRADLLNRILDEVDDIHRKSNYANLQVEKKVPCSCAVCSEAKVPYFFNYDYLVELLNDGEYDERCQMSRKKVDIRDILKKTGIDFKKDRRMRRWEDLDLEGRRDEEQLLVEKLNFLRLEHAKLSDVAQRFQLQKQIQETEKRLKAIRK